MAKHLTLYTKWREMSAESGERSRQQRKVGQGITQVTAIVFFFFLLPCSHSFILSDLVAIYLFNKRDGAMNGHTVHGTNGRVNALRTHTNPHWYSTEQGMRSRAAQ